MTLLEEIGTLIGVILSVIGAGIGGWGGYAAKKARKQHSQLKANSEVNVNELNTKIAVLEARLNTAEGNYNDLKQEIKLIRTELKEDFKNIRELIERKIS